MFLEWNKRYGLPVILTDTMTQSDILSATSASELHKTLDPLILSSFDTHSVLRYRLCYTSYSGILVKGDVIHFLVVLWNDKNNQTINICMQNQIVFSIAKSSKPFDQSVENSKRWVYDFVNKCHTSFVFTLSIWQQLKILVQAKFCSSKSNSTWLEWN